MKDDFGFRALLAALRDGGEVIDGLYERNEGAIRSLEGLEKYKGWYRFEGEDGKHPLTGTDTVRADQHLKDGKAVLEICLTNGVSKGKN